MKMNIKITDKNGSSQSYDIRCSYLVKFVNPNQEYPLTYTIRQDGTKINEPAILKGEDLTEPQIIELFIKELL